MYNLQYLQISSHSNRDIREVVAAYSISHSGLLIRTPARLTHSRGPQDGVQKVYGAASTGGVCKCEYSDDGA
jgi:hypothetical protein